MYPSAGQKETTMALIIRDLYKSYSDFTMSLDLTVEEGETLVLAGPSGCGKTTALQLISGLLEPDRGSINLNGKDITKMPPWQRNVAMVFQDLALFPHLNAGKNIAYGPAIKGIKKEERRQIVMDNLSLVRLSGYEKRRVQTLSGGERQRIAIARALAYKPEVLLFDEPFSSLDTPLRRELRDNFLEIRKKLRIPCIFVTHDREEAAVTADRIAVMDHGKIVETGNSRDLFLFPKTRIAAEFFGFGQVFPCETEQVQEGTVRIRSPLGQLEIPSVNSFKENSSFFFLPRDAVRMFDDTRPNPGQIKKLPAVFRRAIYRGDSLIYETELPSGTGLSSDADLRKSIPQNGDTVDLIINQELIHFVE